MNIETKLNSPQVVEHIFKHFEHLKPSFRVANFNQGSLQIIINDSHRDQKLYHQALNTFTDASKYDKILGPNLYIDHPNDTRPWLCINRVQELNEQQIRGRIGVFRPRIDLMCPPLTQYF